MSFVSQLPSTIGRSLATWPGRLAAGGLVVALVGTAVIAPRLTEGTPRTELRTAPVARASVTQTAAVSGSVNAAGQVRLAFKSAGRLSEVLVKVGESVAAGQPLAKLDLTDLQIALKQAEANLTSAQAKYDQAVAGATPEDVAIARNTVDAAQRTYEQTQKAAQNDAVASQQAVDNAKRSLEQTQRTTQNDVAAAFQALNKVKTSFSASRANLLTLTGAIRADIVAYQDAIVAARTQLTAARDRLDLVVRTGDVSSARASLNAADTALANADTYAKGALATAAADHAATLDALLVSVNAFDAVIASSADTTTVSSQFQTAQASYQTAASRLGSALDAPNAQLATAQTSVTAAQSSLTSLASRPDVALDPSRADLAALQTALTNDQQLAASIKSKSAQGGTALTTVGDAISGSYVSAKQSYAATQTKSESSVQSAQSALVSAQQGLQATQDRGAASLVSQENSLRSAQLSLRKTTAAPRSFDIASVYSSVLVQQAALEKAQNDVANATLRAPVGGLVASVASQVGEFVAGGSSTNPFMVIAQTSTLALHGTVGEAEIAKLRLGQVATITVDAVGAASRMTGRVTALDPVATIQQGVPVYGVDVQIDIPARAIRPGMSGTAAVIVASKQGVLAVPNLAVRSQGGRRFVQVLRDGTPQDAEVEFGISNESLTEVVSGLEEGEQVLLPAPRAGATQRPGGPIPGGPIPGGGIRGPGVGR